MATLLKPSTVLALTVAVGLLSMSALNAQAESLFRARADYQAQASAENFTPRSLFTVPRPQGVGDMVTILINERTINQTQIQTNLKKENTIETNAPSLMNRAIGVMLGKVPFLNNQRENQVQDFFDIPDFNGLDNQNENKLNVQATKQALTTDTISCQVVQVLPNGNLLVQGHKRSMAAKEQTDMFVSGVVNPFYIDRNNQIQSSRVANLQIMYGGKGVISRQQNDGVASKIYQFFN